MLENISDAAGCQFTIDAGWEDYPVTASFKHEPLYRVLKRIFRDFNNAVIYGSDRRIKIIIYDESSPSGKKAGYPVAIKPAEAAISQAQPYSDATAPQPEVLVPEDSSGAESVEQPSEENSGSVSEVNQAGTESTEAAAEPAEAQTEENTSAIESQHDETAVARDNSQADMTESATDSSDSSEKTESSEDSDQN